MPISGLLSLRVLILEDRPADAELVVHELTRSGFDPQWHRVDSEPDYLAALGPDLDVILSDFSMPGFDATRALELLRERHLDVPFIVVSGSVGEETAVRAMQSGAADYLLKDRLARLGQAVVRATEKRRLQREKQLAEDTFHHFADQMQDGVWIADAQLTRVLYANAALEEIWARSGASFNADIRTLFDAVHPDDTATVIAALEAARATPVTFEHRVLRPDGDVRWLRHRAFSMLDGTTARLVGIAEDTTDRRQLEEQLRQSQKMDAVGQLAGSVAHDFNNLLTAIQGYAEFLGEELEGTEHQPAIGEIRRASERAASLTRQLLAFSRRQIVQPRVIDLRETLNGMQHMLRRLIGENIRLTFPLAAAGRVRADPGQIEQIVLNLALNGRDAMPDGGTLVIELADAELDEAYASQHPDTDAGPCVMLAVRDTGIGMAAATQARIFEPFFTTKEMGRGTGLGLSTVYGIVKQSGGCIDVSSAPGQGTTVRIYLPRVEEPVDRTDAQPVPTSLAGTETILVVEDEPGVRSMVLAALRRYQYRVLVAETPEDALHILRSHEERIDLLLSDLVLPQMSGHQLAQHAMAWRAGIRVLFMSGYTDDAVLHRGALGKDTPFLAKPFTPLALARKVREVLPLRG